MKVIVDRFEGGFAVCEDENRKMINIEKAKLPKDTGEGSILIINGDHIEIDLKETKSRQTRIKNLMDSLWEK